MMRLLVCAILTVLLVGFVLGPVAGCAPDNSGVQPDNQNDGGDDDGDDGDDTNPPSQLLYPGDLSYQGAFRVPGGSNGTNWEWCNPGGGMTYYPGGDAMGASDNYPGSLFASGFALDMQISEISIPEPKKSSTKNCAELNTATTIQPFRDIIGQLVNVGSLEIPRVGLQYLPAQGNQGSGKLYFCWAQHFQEQVASHGWCGTDLSNPNVAGAWFIGDYRIYSVNDYMFDIPEYWAEEYTPGMRLVTGRFRDGGWSGQGPALFAIGPWNHGNPPPPGTRLEAVPLILYTSTEDYDAPQYTMNDYHHSDEWTGGAWIATNDKTAVVFVGTKGTGECWYGDQNGPCLDCAGDRGWWSDNFEGRIIFYDPSDLADVAQGIKQPHEPQPYAFLKIDSYLYHIRSTQQWYHTGAVGYDRERGILYVLEPNSDGDKPLIHVWKID